MKKIVAVIPARYQSSRFPGKPLVMIAGKPMIQRVYEQVKKVTGIARVIVATDDMRIYDRVRQFNGNVVMTGECSCGTERVHEAVRDNMCDIVINVQGDEPLIKPEMVEDLLAAFDDETVVMATLCKEIGKEDEINNPNIVKVVRDKNHDAVYFSRYAVPYVRDKMESVKYFKHIGIYAYKKDFLGEYVRMKRMPLETAENLEQLRVLENGHKIRVNETHCDSMGVDTPEDVLRIERELQNSQMAKTKSNAGR